MVRNNMVRILVVDDDEDICHLISDALSRAGFEPVCAYTAEKAMGVIKKKTPVDLILLDVMLPGMDGREFAAKLKKNPRYLHIPIIMMSAVAKSLHEQVLGLRDGADDYLLKPFEMKEVVRKIHDILHVHLMENRETNNDVPAPRQVQRPLPESPPSTAEDESMPSSVEDSPSDDSSPESESVT